MRKLMCALMLGGLATCQAVMLAENGKASHVIVVADNGQAVLRPGLLRHRIIKHSAYNGRAAVDF